MSTVQSDDLSADATGPTSQTSPLLVPSTESGSPDELLKAAAWRRRLRILAAGFAAAIAIFLGYLIYTVICALIRDLAFISVHAVTVVGSLVLAMTVLTIALLRSVFGDRPDSGSDSPSDPAVTTNGLELLKELRAAITTIIEGATGKK